MRAVTAVLMVAFVAGAGCRSRESSQPPPPPPPMVPIPPPDLAVQQLDFARFELSWRGQERYPRYEIECQAEGEAFQPVTDPDGDPLLWYSTSIVVVMHDAPELLRLTFRVRAVLGEVASDWSVSPAARIGVLPVTGLTAVPGEGAGDWPPIEVRWTHPTELDAEVAVERAVGTYGSGSHGPWSSFPAGPIAATDVPSTDGADYYYRVRRGREGVWSPWAEVRASYPLLAPADVRVEPVTVDDSVTFRISWRNRSVTASGLSIRRTSSLSSLPVATLPAGTTSYLERAPVWSSWRYQIEATSAATTGVRSAVAEPPPFLLPGDPPVEATVVELPCESGMLRAGHGGWVCRVSNASEPTLAWMDPAGAWQQRTFPAGFQLLGLDGEDAPHLMYQGGDPPGRWHMWRDGTEWRSEAVAIPPIDPTQPSSTWPYVVASGLGAAGAPVFFLKRGYPPEESFGVLTRTETGWAERPIRLLPEHTWFRAWAFAVAPDGTAVLLGGANLPDENRHCVVASLAPDAPDALAETVPGSAGACSADWNGLLVGAAAQRTVIAYSTRRDSGEQDWFLSERGADGWSEPELVVTQPLSRRVIVPRGALSRDGSRAALVLSWPDFWYADPQTYKAFVRGPQGGWRELTLGPGFPSDGRARAAGFLDDDRLWIMGDDEAPFYGARRYGLYEELRQ